MAIIETCHRYLEMISPIIERRAMPLNHINWIRIEDEIPEDKTHVLVYFGDSILMEKNYKVLISVSDAFYDNGKFFLKHDESSVQVSHWVYIEDIPTPHGFENRDILLDKMKKGN